jgi:hypothetical protein
LDENAQNQMRQLRDILASCALGSGRDKPIWNWEKTKDFLSKPGMLTYVELTWKILTKESGKLSYP